MNQDLSNGHVVLAVLAVLSFFALAFWSRTTKYALLLALAACGGKAATPDTTPPAPAPAAAPAADPVAPAMAAPSAAAAASPAGPATAYAADSPLKFASVAALKKGIADDAQQLAGKRIELDAQYSNSQMQKHDHQLSWNVILVDSLKEASTASFVCKSKDKVTLGAFAPVTARGTFQDGALGDCTISPR